MPLRDTSPERLLVAIWDRDRRLVRRLLDQGALTDVVDHDGRSPLMHAVFENDPAVVALLLAHEHPADVHHRDKGGWAALHYAATARSPEIVKLLLDAGADPNVRDDDKNTPLIDVVCGGTHGRRDTIGVLLRHGASPTLKNVYGNSARSIALLSKDEDLRLLTGSRNSRRRRPSRSPKDGGAQSPPLPLRATPVIARRSLELKNERGTRAVEVAVTKPARHEGSWYCPMLITGLTPGRRTVTMWGADSMQALVHALQIAGVHVQTKARDVRWLGQRNLGFPPMWRSKRKK